jgi:1-deoxy-D-xylulose-5-phosphate reductoisomerase
MNQSKNIAVLGATGSVGQNALTVINAVEEFNLFAISGNQNISRLIDQAIEHRPSFAIVSDEAALNRFLADGGQLPSLEGTEFLVGESHLEEIVSLPQVDTVLAAIVGIAGLPSTFAAVRAGKRVALANKESMVVAGHLITQVASESGAEILPVDSEHSAIFQAMRAGRSDEVGRVILTASGGPFRELSANAMSSVTVEQALSHPTWDMGQKISIDSATMMNKALELIEAKWLFNLSPNQLEVVIHPQSIVHSIVEYIDGSSIAQLSPPDMMLPIQYAFSYPDRVAGPCPRLDLKNPWQLAFFPPDSTRFPALELGYEVVKMGGTSGTVLNAANEAAVDAFLNNKIGFTDIAEACRDILDKHYFDPFPDMDGILEADRWARLEISKWITA